MRDYTANPPQKFPQAFGSFLSLLEWLQGTQMVAAAICKTGTAICSTAKLVAAHVQLVGA